LELIAFDQEEVSPFQDIDPLVVVSLAMRRHPSGDRCLRLVQRIRPTGFRSSGLDGDQIGDYSHLSAGLKSLLRPGGRGAFHACPPDRSGPIVGTTCNQSVDPGASPTCTALTHSSFSSPTPCAPFRRSAGGPATMRMPTASMAGTSGLLRSGSLWTRRPRGRHRVIR